MKLDTDFHQIRTMNSSSRPEDFPGPGGSTVENVSRSGRVRKKNTLLAEYDSPTGTVLEKLPKKKPDRIIKEKDHSSPAKVTLKFGGEVEPHRKKVLKKMKTSNKKMKFSKGHVDVHSRPSHHGGFEPLLLAAQMEGDLEMDLPPEFETDMPILAAEEIIDESLLDAEDSMTEITEHMAINRLKSQAQSTYMMEKTMEKNRKITGLPGNGGKAKAARKDKGNPRVTAYMLWAKDQREIFAKKYPNLDFSSLSKKLSDLWATVPQNQKKMWKNKAGKIMRKSTNVMENIKNSGPLPPLPGKGKKARGRPRIHAAGDEDELPLPLPNSGKNTTTPVRKSPQVGKSSSKKPGNFLPSTEKPINKSPATSTKSTWQNKSTTKPKPSRNSKGTPNSVGLHLGSVKVKTKLVAVESKPSLKTSLTTAIPSTSFSLSNIKQLSPRKDEESSLHKVTGTAPIDVAAHFALLGESLSVIGERLKDVEGQTVSGSLSVLLDSLLCATGPLLCLSQQVPELNCIPQEKLAHLLDNIAYVMPGL